jgi:hypothetical protein
MNLPLLFYFVQFYAICDYFNYVAPAPLRYRYVQRKSWKKGNEILVNSPQYEEESSSWNITSGNKYVVIGFLE